MVKTSTLRPIDEWEMALNRSQTQSGSMSHLGQFQKSACANAMSAFLPIATELRTSLEVRFVPQAEVTGGYSISLSARSKNAGGTVTPIAFAVLRLITSSNFVGRSTGMSATLSPRNSLIIC
jgi:hypothetical protein